MRFAISLLVAILCTSVSRAEQRIPLIINEPFADRTVPWPITTGVPFPRGALKSKENCRLVDERGRAQPLQAKVAATWDADKTSIRWLTIDFIAQPQRKYTLEFGDEIQNNVGRRDRLEAGDRMWIGSRNGGDMGYLAEFNRTTPAAFESVHIDLDENGFVSPGERALHGGPGGEHYFIDQKGRRHSNALDKLSRRIVAEADGNIHRTIRVEGDYTDPNGERIAKYRTRYHYFQNLPVMKVVDELRFVGSTKKTQFRDIGFSMNLDLATENRQVTFDQDGSPGNSPLTVPWRSDTKAISSCQRTYRHYGNPECVGEIVHESDSETKQLKTTTHVGEWVQVADSRFAVTGSLRWFWQQFPKEWEVTKDSLTLHYWSPRAGTLDFGKAGIEQFFGEAGTKYLRAGLDTRKNHLDRFFYHADHGAIERGEADGLGINKHHEFWLVFTPAKDAAKAQEYAKLAAVQPLCLASGEWNCSTDVFGPLAARPNDSKYEAAVDKLFDLGRQGQDDFGDYGWWLFGAGPHYSYHTDEQTGKLYADARRFEYHTYGKETQLWWNYVRSGERKFYDWAIPSENHWVDIAVSHEPTKIHCDWLGGDEVPGRTLHWRPGEWSIDNPTHYVRTHDRAEAWLRGGAQFWASYHRTLETTTLAHYLTGDERYNDVINYWRAYWGGLAGVTNKSQDVPAWYREQAWFKPAKDGEREKNWAEMIRDYAPFSSGSRHQLTLFFNLATLYEHTWDPKIKQALDEYAGAFLDPAHPLGVWRSQDNSLPAHADAPLMGHFWVPALWKYARVTNDPRMPEIFQKYFAAGYAADPFRTDEKVGVYSNSYIGYAYYFTHDPRFLALAENELNQLLPNAAPLGNPQEINSRLYNPYAPARTFAGVPRLLWAVQEANKSGVEIPQQPLRPQRTAISLAKKSDESLRATLWGFDPKLKVIGPSGEPLSTFQVKTTKYSSEIQPFDRKLTDYDVYLHELEIAAAEPGGNYILAPHLELAVLNSNTSVALWNAVRPLELKTGEAVWIKPASSSPALVIESAQPAMWRVRTASGEMVVGKIAGNRAEFAPAVSSDRPLQLDIVPGHRQKKGWFQIVNREPVDCWVQPGGDSASLAARSVPAAPATDASLPAIPVIDETKTYVAGRFGNGLQLVSGRRLHLPDHVSKGDQREPVWDEKEGTFELWVKKLTDERTNIVKQPTLLTNGIRTVPNHADLPLNEWAHIAVVWLPYQDQGTLTYVYVNGRDASVYRSLNWAGYSSARPSAGVKNAKWLEEFVVQAMPGFAYAIDELRISKVARYADPKVVYGPQQTFNPFRFQPPEKAFVADDETTLLMHFDGDLRAATPTEIAPARLGK